MIEYPKLEDLSPDIAWVACEIDGRTQYRELSRVTREHGMTVSEPELYAGEEVFYRLGELPLIIQMRN